MKEYTKEERKEIIELINKIQRAEFNFKKENERTPSNEEIASIVNLPIEKIIELKEIINELNTEDKELELDSKKHTKEDIIKARERRKNNKVIQDIKSYIKFE